MNEKPNDDSAPSLSENMQLSLPISQTRITQMTQDQPIASTKTPALASSSSVQKASEQTFARNQKPIADEDKGKDFEAALSELEKIVAQLEGEVKLEEALKLFDRGMNLSQHCQECLVEAEQRIDILKRAINGNLVSEKFNEESLSTL